MIPEGWELSLLGEGIKLLSGQHIVASDYSDQPNGVPYLTGPADFSQGRIIVTKYTNRPKVKCNAGDILITVKGSGTGKIVRADAIYCISRQLMAVRAIKWDKDFLYYFLDKNNERYANAASGLIPGISREDVLETPILLPPLPEQRRIAEILSTWDEAITLTERLITARQRRKKALMQQLLTGWRRFREFEGEEWRDVSLQDVAAKSRYSFTGGPFGSDLKAQDYTESGVRIIQLQNIGDGKFLDSYKIYTSEQKANELIGCNIYPGDIIISKMGDPVARAALIPNTNRRYLMASDGIRLEVDKSKYDVHFILESINTSTFRKNAIKHSTGSTRQRIGLGDLRKLPLAVPSLPEQRKISAVLQACDEEIELLGQKLAALKRQKQGLMQQLLTGQVRVKDEG